MNKHINTSVRNKELRFYKEDGEWYADVAEHTQAENRMVAGADALIESFARGGNEVRIVLSADHDAWGATYLAHIKGFLLPRPAWLYNVTHTVFGGEHPRTIYIHSVAA